MEKMKRCETCLVPLMSMGYKLDKFYLHPAKPCAGVTDSIRVKINVMDEEVYKKWKGYYGEPKKTDYEIRIELEEDYLQIKNEYYTQLFWRNKVEKHWLFKLIKRWIR